MNMIISGYGHSTEKTIGLFKVENGRFTGQGWSDSTESPAFVCGGDGYVFAAKEAGKDAAYYIYRDGRLSDSIALEGCGALCHIAYSPKHSTIYGACYGTGNIRAAAVDAAKGCFTGETQNYLQGGRAHSVLLTCDEATLYSANIAQDLIYVYEISAGRLGLVRTFDTGKGRGPRHMALSDDERLLYVITEYSNEILVFETDTGRLIQAVWTLPERRKKPVPSARALFFSGSKKLYAPTASPIQ